MHPLAVHWTLVQKRTQIRHDKRTLLWILRCWQAARRFVSDSSPSSLNRDEYNGIYKRLLTAMTIEWRDDDFRAIVDSMWCRDASAFTDLNEDRFSCSIFSFAEMWVETLEVSEYARVLQLIHRLLSSATSDERIVRRSNPTSLTAFLDALVQETHLVAMNVCIGKSTDFDAEQYARIFGQTAPQAISTMVISKGSHKPTTRHSRTLLLPTFAATGHHTYTIRSLVSPCRPRSCSAFVRFDDAASTMTTSINRPLAVACRSKADSPTLRAKPHPT